MIVLHERAVHQFFNDIHTSSKEKVMRITPFAVHYEKICIHLHEKATNSAEIHSLEQKKEYLHINQI